MNLAAKKLLILGISAVLFVAIASAGLVWWRLGDNTGYAPEQPIPFSHKKHAGDLKIPCAYCHGGIDESKHATVPAMNVCMNCHSVVKTDSPHIQKLTELYHQGKPLEWIRIHDLPEHARFNHERHIKAGIDCAMCHGDVANMERVEQKKSLQMGFCLECHRNPEINAPINCQSCHY